MDKKQINKKRLRRLIIIAGIVAVFCVGCSREIYFIVELLAPPISEEKMNKIFEKDKEWLKQIATYFEESGYEHIAVWDTYYLYDTEDEEKGTMLAYNDEDPFPRPHVPIDPEIEGIIEKLLIRKHYGSMGKNGNTIYFHRGYIRDGDRGIAYTIDGFPPEREYLVYYSKLSEDHWYYYYADADAEYKRSIGVL